MLKVRCYLLRHLLALLIPLLVFSGGARAQEAYRIATGDTLNIEVHQIAELSRRVAVDLDGAIAFPLIGSLRVDGLTLEEIRQLLGARLAESGALSNPQILVEVDQMRPVYINGDVARPGEYPFRPGISIRQLIAVAGGFDILNFRASNPMVQLPEFRAERDTAWVELMRQEIQLAVLQAELEGEAEPRLPSAEAFPVPIAVFTRSVDLETRLSQARATERAMLRDHLRRVIVLNDEQITAMQEQLRQDEVTVRQLNEDLTQTRSLYSRGLTSLNRLQEQQRSLAQSQSRLSETFANIARAGREKEEFAHRLHSQDGQRRAELLAEIGSGLAQVRALRVRLESATEKLMYAGALNSQLMRGSRGAVEIIVHRREGGSLQRLVADQDTVLRPGDAIQISLSHE